MEYYTCPVCDTEFPAYFQSCYKCGTPTRSNPQELDPFQLLLPSIMGKTAVYMREKYKRVPEATHVHDITRCSTKREMEERFPELAETVLFKPPVQIGEMLHTFIESLPTIDKAQQVFERRVNRHLVVGKPDITTEDAVYDLKYRERLYRRPLEHDVWRASIYAWLAEKPHGHIIYLNPREFREWVYLPATTEAVLYLIEHPKSPRWRWECRICAFKTVCPIRVPRSSSQNPQYPPFERRISRYTLEVEPPHIIPVIKSPQAWVLVTHRRATRMKLLGWKTVPEILYPIPKLIVEEMPIEEQKYVAGLIEGEGCLRPVRDRRNRIDEEYKYVYLRPVFVFDMTEEPPVKRVAKALGLEYHTYPRPPPRQDRYEIHTTGTPAISIAHWALPHLTLKSKKAKDAQALLKTFRETPSIKLR